MKEISLTQGKIAQVDDSDFEYLNQWKWYVKKINGNYYAEHKMPRAKSRALLNKKVAYESMHRLIMNTPEGMFVDHIDHNGLNCQKSNMRICTHAENNSNRNPNANKVFKGVHVQKGSIVARIKINKKLLYLGTHNTLEDAARAYDKAAKKHFKEFANLNFK